MAEVRLAVIGGSGLYHMPQLENVETIEVSTPFGAPSSPITLGRLHGLDVAFLARHGTGHTLSPSEVPYQANVFALKLLGTEKILSVSAVGSLREDYAPLDVVVPNQIFDRTTDRPRTFFGGGLVGHVAFAHPFCPALSGALFQVAERHAGRAHRGGTLIVIEGPQFSTIAESETYRQLGFSVIGMTAAPEAKLAREAEICYATAAMVTDYDVWHLTHQQVTSDMVAENVRRNTELAHALIGGLVAELDMLEPCDCHDALASALLTHLDLVPEAKLKELEPIIGRYMNRAVAGAHG